MGCRGLKKKKKKHSKRTIMWNTCFSQSDNKIIWAACLWKSVLTLFVLYLFWVFISTPWCNIMLFILLISVHCIHCIFCHVLMMYCFLMMRMLMLLSLYHFMSLLWDDCVTDAYMVHGGCWWLSWSWYFIYEILVYGSKCHVCLLM